MSVNDNLEPTRLAVGAGQDHVFIAMNRPNAVFTANGQTALEISHEIIRKAQGLQSIQVSFYDSIQVELDGALLELQSVSVVYSAWLTHGA